MSFHSFCLAVDALKKSKMIIIFPLPPTTSQTLLYLQESENKKNTPAELKYQTI